jgi:uncharacterized membrane protein YfcA
VRQRVAPIAIGLAAGLSAGLFGVGGGVLAVPGLVLLVGMAQVTASATSLAAIVVSASAALVPYIVAGNVDWGATEILLVGAIAGAVGTNRILHRIPNRALSLAFTATVLVAAIRMITSQTPANGSAIGLDLTMIVILLVLGLVSGALATGLGIGGAVIYVPVLAVGFGLIQHVAQGTALAVIVPTAIIGTVGHHKKGRVVWPVAVVLAVGGLVGGLVGGIVAQSIDPEQLRRYFAVVLVLLAARMLKRTIADYRTVPTG